MQQATIIGIDLAKNTFQLHGAAADGSVVFRKKLSRAKVLAFLATQPSTTVAMEACASAHHWGREIATLGHEVRLIAPIYVKPFVKRQKNDAADAEAITEAASRPTMRFVEVKSAEQQGQGMLFRTRDLLVRQRTQTINALRGHLAEFGIVAAQGPARVEGLAKAVEDETTSLPEMARELARLLVGQVAELDEKIGALEREIRRRAPKDPKIARLMTIPGVGAICATAIHAFAPSMSTFGSGRDFAAWVGLTPRQNSTGGKVRLGSTSKMGQRDIRRLLIIGASAVVTWAGRKGPRPGSWLARMMARKPHMLVVVALANKMARMIWAIATRETLYKDPVAA
ncbi:MAG: IS110 family transposase [Pseudomonadota bacterium]